MIGLMRGLHMAIGIHTPPPEQERQYVWMWIGIIVFLAAGMMLMFYLLK
jgi:Mg2+ and Co2+ transporter CorA